ncbi:chloride channel protein [Paractinoplanes globisporus]|uniref:Chloride channel protein n=1 Tax=Paractinoplanes globisporus TaxID=113565 RepID=A0ABW6WVM5_9ACTN|nr:chloride channel protein [Actinoplanes globisporus]
MTRESAPADAGPPAAAEQPTPRQYLWILVVAALLGIPVAFAAAAFMSLTHVVTTLVWTTIPEHAAWSGGPPWWYVVLMPVVAGLVVAIALRLPGHAGEPAVAGIGLAPLRPVELLSALLAALAALGLGLVLGPEAPLTALGLSAGLVATRALRPSTPGANMLVIAGAFAAISTVFDGPLPSALLLFELVARSGAVPAAVLGQALLPGLLASGTAALVFTGIDHWPGVTEVALQLPALPNYPTVRLPDVAWCLLVAVVAAVVAAGARGIAVGIAARTAKLPRVVVLCCAGALVGGLAIGFRAATGQSVDLVLFSGEDSLPQVLGATSAGVLALLILMKGAAYALSLGAAFRGGPTFPAVTLGVAVGVLAALVLPGLDLTPAVVAGLAAAAAAALRLPFFGALLAALLAGSVAAETIPIAVIAAVVGWLVATVLHQRETRRESQAASAGR